MDSSNLDEAHALFAEHGRQALDMMRVKIDDAIASADDREVIRLYSLYEALESIIRDELDSQ